MMNKPVVLVTGAAGFIGSFLCEMLLSKGYSVVGIDNLFRGSLDNFKELPNKSQFEFIRMDMSDPITILLMHDLIVSRNITMVFHLAAINGTQYFYDRSLFVLDQNCKITQNLTAAIENTKVNYIIYSSSSEVYGDPLSIPTKETDPILLNAHSDRDSYAASKALGDFYIRLFSQKNNINSLILRIFNMYGERMINTRYGQVIPEFIKRMLENEEFTLIGNGTQTRSFCYIKDATHLIGELVEKQVTGIINLGNNEEISILDLAKKIHALDHKAFNPVFLPERPHDHRRRCPDIAQLQSILSPITFTSLDQGLLKVINYYKNLPQSS
jgi:nucleoside-diphosphate-sugar epimerase